MDWRVKGCVQGVLARIPGGVHLNDALQLWQGGRRNAAGHVADKVQRDWVVMMRFLRDVGVNVRDGHVMEIGTGWLPVLPLCFVLAGARGVHTFDLNRHMHEHAPDSALRHLGPLIPLIAREAGLPEGSVRDRHAELSRHAGGDLLHHSGIRYHAPADAAATGLPDASIDLVISNSVLEHVAHEHLAPMMRESRRLLSPDGVALHSVNCGDHYAYFDRSITPLHYLRFSSAQWRRWNNDIQFQNRLRPSDFTTVAQQAGLEVVRQIQTVKLELLPQIEGRIAEEFRHYTAEDLCTTSVTFAARPATGGARVRRADPSAPGVNP